LARFFLQQHSEAMERNILDITPEAEQALINYSWPGNVRQLGNVLERAVALCSGDHIEIDDLPADIFDIERTASTSDFSQVLPPNGMDLESTVAEYEISLIRQALDKCRYSQKRAAGMLGLTPRSLRYRLQKYNLESE